MTINLNRFKEQLVLHEDLKLKPYTDTVGKITIGVGRNLTDKGLSKEESLYLLDNDIKESLDWCQRQFWWPAVKDDDVRARVMLDMAFNMGPGRFAQFKLLFKSVLNKSWDNAADQMERSLWFKQVGTRAKRLQAMMRTGIDYVK